MSEYMSIIRFASSMSEEFMSLVPKQRLQINHLMEKGIITSYSLSLDRGTLWMTWLTNSLEEVETMLKIMPLFKFMHYDIIELMFHQRSMLAQMHLSMN
jgi:hypothetical protein